MSTSQFKINLHSGESGDVYIQYVSGLKQTLLGKKKPSNRDSTKSDLEWNVELESNILKIIHSSIKSEEDPYIIIPNSENYLLLHGEKYGLCVCFYINDYSQYTQKFIENNDYVHQYMSEGKTYISILSKKNQQLLVNTAIDIFKQAFNKEPVNIYIKVTSKTEYENKITDEVPTDIEKYKLIENITYDKNIENLIMQQFEIKLNVPKNKIHLLESMIDEQNTEFKHNG